MLASPVCKYVKIGGTDYPPLKRIKEINSCEPYKSLGPWSLHDFRQVSDWRKVECALHYALRSKLVKNIKGQKELFAISSVEASSHLERIDESLVVKKPKVDRMFQDREFSYFLARLFRFTAILNWVDYQGAWTFCLFPSTKGDRRLERDPRDREVPRGCRLGRVFSLCVQGDLSAGFHWVLVVVVVARESPAAR